jgi:hypothetical protein
MEVAGRSKTGEGSNTALRFDEQPGEGNMMWPIARGARIKMVLSL